MEKQAKPIPRMTPKEAKVYNKPEKCTKKAEEQASRLARIKNEKVVSFLEERRAKMLHTSEGAPSHTGARAAEAGRLRKQIEELTLKIALQRRIERERFIEKEEKRTGKKGSPPGC